MVFFVIGGILCVLNYFRIEVTPNQEIYMAMAKWWSDPSWIPNSYYFSDPPGTRIGFVAIMQPFWKYFSFETVVMGATFLNLFALGGILFLIAKQVTKSSFVLVLLMHLTLFSGIGVNSFYAGEWMLGGAEPKTFAYLFALWGLLFFIQKKNVWPFLLLAIAAYFHVLVAGWMLLILLLETWYAEGFKKTFKPSLIFLAGITPLFIYLLSSYFNKGLGTFAGADAIFVTELKNHLRPWLVKGREGQFYGGLFLSFLGSGIAFYRSKTASPKIALLYRLSLYSFLIPTFFVLLASWEWFTPFLKLFPFRLSLMQKILLLLAICSEISERLEHIAWKRNLNIGLGLILIVSGASRLNKNIIQKLATFEDKSFSEITTFVSRNFKAGTTFLFIDTKIPRVEDRKLISLSRMSRINLFYVQKFLPFSSEKILEWNRRLLLSKTLIKNPDQPELLENEDFDFILSRRDLNLKLVHEINGYKFYKYELEKK